MQISNYYNHSFLYILYIFNLYGACSCRVYKVIQAMRVFLDYKDFGDWLEQDYVMYASSIFVCDFFVCYRFASFFCVFIYWAIILFAHCLFIERALFNSLIIYVTIYLFVYQTRVCRVYRAWFSYVADGRRFIVGDHLRRKFTKDLLMSNHRQWTSPMSATYEQRFHN